MNNKNFALLIPFLTAIAIGLVHSCLSGPSIGQIRKAREMLRVDMSILRKQVSNVASFDDDRKTKVGSAILSLEITPASWTQSGTPSYVTLLDGLGWKRAAIATGIIFMCKQGASASIIEPPSEINGHGYINMKYPADPRARCQ